jgi:hypothetical protein
MKEELKICLVSKNRPALGEEELKRMEWRSVGGKDCCFQGDVAASPF